MSDDRLTPTGARWARVMVEVAVIVGSILLAFAIDAGWEERRERSREQALLLNLEAEFVENVDQLDNLLTFHKKVEDTGTRFLNLSWGRGEFPSVETIDSMLVAVFLDVATFNSASGTLSSFLAAGSPELIRNERLRGLLYSWPGLLEDNAEDELRVVKLIDEQLTPFLRAHSSLAHAFTADSAAHSRYGVFNVEPRGADFTRLVQSPEFQNHVTTRVALERLVQREYGKLKEAAAEILTELRQGIDSRQPRDPLVHLDPGTGLSGSSP